MPEEMSGQRQQPPVWQVRTAALNRQILLKNRLFEKKQANFAGSCWPAAEQHRIGLAEKAGYRSSPYCERVCDSGNSNLNTDDVGAWRANRHARGFMGFVRAYRLLFNLLYGLNRLYELVT